MDRKDHPPVEYHVLGPLEVVRGGASLDVGSPKQRSVLAALLLEAGRVVSAERLVDAVWGDDPPGNVAASLQAYISNLRRLLRDDDEVTSPIVRQMPGYRIDVAAGAIDSTRFRDLADRARTAAGAADWPGALDHAQAALALWRGPLLADMQDESWVQLASVALQERRTECREDLVTALLGCDRVSQAVTVARELYVEQPLRERACWLYVLALHRDGRTTEALDVHRAHVRSLDDELGLEPGVALRDLQSGILRQQPDLLTWPLRPGPAPATPTPGVVEPEVSGGDAAAADAPADAARSGRDVLVGRGHELAAVDAAVADAVAGDVRWLVLTGPAGIGKTRLALEVIARAEAAGLRTIRTSCPDDDGTPAWLPMAQVVRALGAEPREVFAPPADADADRGRWEIYGRVTTLLAEATGSAPVAVLVDDVQWADPASLGLLTNLASSAVADRVLLVLTVREDTGGPQLQVLLEAAARRQGSRQLGLPPLLPDEVRELVHVVSGEQIDADEARLLSARTGGNPFFVGEYARLPRAERLAGDMPVAVRSVLGRRLAGLDAGVLQVLRTAAVIGDPLDVDLLMSVTRLDADELADLLDEAADERIVVAAPGGHTYTFAHGLLREEVLSGMSDIRRQRLHARVAAAIVPQGGPVQLARRAAHLVAALPLSDATEAFAACQEAAADADQRWVSDSAAYWWETALAVWDQLPHAHRDVAEHDRLVQSRLAALARAGRGQTVLDVVDAAIVDALRDGRTGAVGIFAGTLLRTTGAWPWAVYGSDPGPLLARLEAVEPLVAGDPAAHSRVLAALAVGSCYLLDESVPDRWSARALQVAEDLGDPDVLADALLGRALLYAGVSERVEESRALLDRLAALPHGNERVDEVLRHGLMSMVCALLGDTDQADEHRRLGIVGSDLLRLPVSRVQFRWLEGMLAAWRGDFEVAEATYADAMAAHERTELYRANVDLFSLATLRWDQGRLDELPPTAALAAMGWEGIAIDVARDPASSARLIDQELDRPEPTNWTSHGKLTMLAHLAADAGLVEQGRRVLGRLAPHRGRIAIVGQVGVIGVVSLALARLHLLLGDTGAAREELRSAAELARREHGRPTLLRCRLVAHQLDRADGHTVVAAQLAELAAEAEAGGLLRVASEARSMAPQPAAD